MTYDYLDFFLTISPNSFLFHNYDFLSIIYSYM